MEVKIPLYNLLNMFMVGFIFLGCCIIMLPSLVVQILQSDIIQHLSIGPEIVITISIFAIVYEIGLIINRIGSIVIEPALKKSKIIPFDNDYQKFNDRKKQYPILSTLSREYALSRTSITLFLILAIISLISLQWAYCIAFILILLVYLFSCRKHAKKIVDLMKSS